MTETQIQRELHEKRFRAAVAQVSGEDEAIANLRRYVETANNAGIPGRTLESSLTVADLRALLRYIDAL